jgi:Tfp pilus assembly protein PilZ
LTEAEQSSGAERRRYERIACQIPVRYRLKAQGMITSWKESEAGNISTGGLFITFGEKIPLGDVIALEVRVPGLVGPLQVDARVAWVKEAAGVVECGLEFSGLKPQDKKFLAGFIEKEKGRSKA